MVKPYSPLPEVRHRTQAGYTDEAFPAAVVKLSAPSAKPVQVQSPRQKARTSSPMPAPGVAEDVHARKASAIAATVPRAIPTETAARAHGDGLPALEERCRREEATKSQAYHGQVAIEQSVLGSRVRMTGGGISLQDAPHEP